MQYKLWLEIEEIDEGADHYEDVGVPESLGEFDTEEEARGVMDEIIKFWR